MSELVYESKVTYDGVTKIVTLSFIVLCGAVGLMLFLIVQEPILILLSCTILIMVVAILFLSAPLGFLLTDSGLVIKRPVGCIKIPYSEIAEACCRPEEWSWWLSLRGNIAFAALFSPFWGKTRGKHRVHVTNRRNLVIIETCDQQTFMISPVNPDEFVKRLNRACEIVRALNERFRKQKLTDNFILNHVNP